MGTQYKMNGTCAPVCPTLVMPLCAIVFTKGGLESVAGVPRALPLFTGPLKFTNSTYIID